MFGVARHVIDIELRNPRERGSCTIRYGGTCSCGWQGESWLTRTMAWQDARMHKQDATRRMGVTRRKARGRIG